MVKLLRSFIILLILAGTMTILADLISPAPAPSSPAEWRELFIAGFSFLVGMWESRL